jgi:hypothetical protein
MGFTLLQVHLSHLTLPKIHALEKMVPFKFFKVITNRGDEILMNKEQKLEPWNAGRINWMST